MALEQVDWILELRMGDAVKGYSVLIITVSTVEDEFVELIDKVVDAGLEDVQAALVLVLELGCGSLDKGMHVADVFKLCRTNLVVYGHVLTGLAEILLLRDLERSAPVLPVHGHHEFLEVVHSVDIGRRIILF